MLVSKLVVFFTCLLDAFGIGLVFPLLSPLILEKSGGFVPEIESLVVRGSLLGFALAAYTAAQFFSSPILGALSDQKGRKKMLAICVSLAVLGYVIGGFGIFWKSYSLLLIGRLLEGVASGSISVTYAVLADISVGKAKTHNFGWLGASWSLGFIIGPFAGGYLSSKELSAGFDYATPFWFAALLSAINLLLVLFVFKETYTRRFEKKTHLFQGVINLKRAFSLPALKPLMTAMFIFFLGWETFALFIPIFLIDRFQFNSLDIGNFYAYCGVGFVVGNTFVLRLISHLPADRVIKFVLPIFAVYIFPMTFMTSLPLFLSWLFLIPIIGAVIFALGPLHVSNSSEPHEQGELLGVYQSVQAGSLALPPLLFGSIAAAFPSFSLWGAALFAFLSGLSFWFLKPGRKRRAR